jgi:hypothetical protein
MLANVGLRKGAHKGVPAWTDEGVNDMRNLPVGRHTFGVIEFDVIDPAENEGRAVVRLDPKGHKGPQRITVPVGELTGTSVYFMHALAHNARGVAGVYDVCYADGTEERIYMRQGREFSNWWGATDNLDTRRHNHPVDRNVARVAWRGANAKWKTVGLYMTGWNNPHPDVPITSIRCEAVKPESGAGGIMLAAISVSDQSRCFETSIRSGGLPDTWSQAAVYYAIAEGLAGVEDTGKAFDKIKVSPRWAVSQSDRNAVTLHYPASDGYCSYTYKLDRKKRRITVDLTGSFHAGLLHCLMPGRGAARKVKVNGVETVFQSVKIEQSMYTDVQLKQLPLGPVVIEY